MTSPKCHLLVALGLGLCLSCAAPALASGGKGAAAKADSSSSKNESKKTASKKQATTSAEETVREQIKKLEQALASGDLKAVVAAWGPQGNYTDVDGTMTSGRAALEARFGRIFSEDGKQNVALVVDSVRMISRDVALAQGIVRRKNVPFVLGPETRFSMVFDKPNGSWLLESAIETSLTEGASQKQDRLAELSWLIGDWQAEGKGGTARMQAEWVANKKFISCRYQIRKDKDSPVIESRQVIGFDPRLEKPVSWHFDEGGGFGHSTWEHGANRWTVDAEGVEPDGSVTRATNIITLGDKDNFVWQSIDRSINGESIGDTNTLKVQRVK